jgi:hypothetical protein
MSIRVGSQKLPIASKPEELPIFHAGDVAKKPASAPRPPRWLPPQGVHKGGVGGPVQQSGVVRFENIKRTLEAHPERADALIEQRLRGWNATDRAIVRAAVAERGNTGLARYADAEAALRELGGFSPEERRDVHGIMKAGASFRQAIDDERRALAAPRPPPKAASPAELREQAIANVRKEALELRELGRKVGSLVRQLGSGARAAELVAGAGTAAGLLGSTGYSAAKAAGSASTKPLKALVDSAGDAGEMMVAGATGKGGRTGRIRVAEATAGNFFRASERHTDARARFERAARGGDYEGMAGAKRDVDAAANDMRAHARELAVQVRSIAKWDANLAKGGVAAGAAIIGVGGASPPDKVIDAAVDLGSGIALGEATDSAADRKLNR